MRSPQHQWCKRFNLILHSLRRIGLRFVGWDWDATTKARWGAQEQSCKSTVNNPHSPWWILSLLFLSSLSIWWCLSSLTFDTCEGNVGIDKRRIAFHKSPHIINCSSKSIGLKHNSPSHRNHTLFMYILFASLRACFVCITITLIVP